MPNPFRHQTRTFQFKIYTLYFESLGIFMPAMQVALAGAIELVSAVGLTLGMFTRPVALLGSVYLLMSMGCWADIFRSVMCGHCRREATNLASFGP